MTNPLQPIHRNQVFNERIDDLFRMIAMDLDRAPVFLDGENKLAYVAKLYNHAGQMAKHWGAIKSECYDHLTKSLYKGSYALAEGVKVTRWDKDVIDKATWETYAKAAYPALWNQYESAAEQLKELRGEFKADTGEVQSGVTISVSGGAL